MALKKTDAKPEEEQEGWKKGAGLALMFAGVCLVSVSGVGVLLSVTSEEL